MFKTSGKLPIMVEESMEYTTSWEMNIGNMPQIPKEVLKDRNMPLNRWDLEALCRILTTDYA